METRKPNFDYYYESMRVLCKDVLRTLSNIYDEACFYENGQRFLAFSC